MQKGISTIVVVLLIFSIILVLGIGLLYNTYSSSKLNQNRSEFPQQIVISSPKPAFVIEHVDKEKGTGVFEINNVPTTSQGINGTETAANPYEKR